MGFTIFHVRRFCQSVGCVSCADIGYVFLLWGGAKDGGCPFGSSWHLGVKQTLVVLRFAFFVWGIAWPRVKLL